MNQAESSSLNLPNVDDPNLINITGIENYWGENFFNLLYWRLFMKRNASICMHQTSGILSIVQEKINLNKFSLDKKFSVLDTCSGVSDIAHTLSYMLELKKIDHHIDTIEMSSPYVSIALDQCIEKVSPYCGDVFKFLKTRPKKYDLITNWYSSFGYFEPEQNSLFLRLALESLNPQGIFILECSNSLQVKNNFSPVFSYSQVDPLTLDRYEIERASNIDYLPAYIKSCEQGSNDNKELLPFARLNQKWFYKKDGQDTGNSYDTYSFMYEAKTITNIIESFNLGIEIDLLSSNNSGDYKTDSAFSLEKFNPAHNRLIIVCKKTLA